MHILIFWTLPNFVNISIFHTFPRVRWDIVATSCMLPYKCHIYLKSLCSLVFVGISQHDFVYIKVEENWVSSSIPHFCKFLTVSDILQMLETRSYHTRTSFPMAHFSIKHHAITLQPYQSKVGRSKKVATVSGT